MIHRRALLPVYLPALLLGIPAQASLVLLPLHVLASGGSTAAAAAVVGWHGVGMMAADVPAGLIAARYGERRLMLLATLFIGGAYLGYALAGSVPWFFLIAFFNGAGSSSFLLGRMAYVSGQVDSGARGRVIAMIAGSLRASALLGPLAGGALAASAGFGPAFAVGAGCVVAAFLCLLAFTAHQPPAVAPQTWRALPALAFAHRRDFATAGVAAVVFMLMRAARSVLLPLMGAGLGLDTAAIGFIVALSAAVDVALFYPAGMALDRCGRRATAVPAAVLFTATLAALALVQGYASLLAVGLALGVANGLSTGIVMTLGTDLAPAARRGEFLGLWRLLTDFGSAAGPLVVSAVVAAAPLATAALVVAGIGAGGTFVVWRYVEETLTRRPRCAGPS